MSSTTRPSRARSASPEADTRQRVLDAAATLFLAQGFAATAFDQVRQAAGVSNGSLYHHFGSKAELARALYLLALASYQAATLPALRDAPPAAAGVHALVHRHIDWVMRHPREARVLHELRGAAASDGQPPDWQAANAPAFEPLREWIAQEVRAGRMHELSLSVWLALVIAPLLQLGEAWLRGAAPPPNAALREQLAQAAVRAVTVAHPDTPHASPRDAVRRRTHARPAPAGRSSPLKGDTP